MPLIVADTTPLNYLILIHAIDFLPNLYGRVLIPYAVRTELAHPSAPEVVRSWISNLPAWLEVHKVSEPFDRALAGLDLGEQEAISLASKLHSSLLLIDERDGVRAARQMGLDVVGTLAVLDLGAERGLCDLPTILARLRDTTFRSPARVITEMLQHDAERRKRKL